MTVDTLVSAAAKWKPTPLPHQDVAPGFHVPYIVKESEFGKGLFAATFIPANTLVWKFSSRPMDGVPPNVRVFHSRDELERRMEGLSPGETFQLLEHMYGWAGLAIEALDEMDMMNHSEHPNTGPPVSEAEGQCAWSSYNMVDLQPGDQFLEDYSTFKSDWFKEMQQEHGVMYDFLNKNASG
eukprot:NODE_1290_length_984_cov_43.517647_g991_i0.p1 GENE.NODE_1290_length_984_cov_43.517647_g991_i0~~NODE_1290_length_984_cov_43.517647_g991_i0.p1  ORF type:complete len:182 (-),score=42.21 NODE_1290_length_984_cov_43.517647_g991_i0:382-927(-)